MVVWVFAGGGEAEVRGLIPFLEKNFPGCSFKRKTPINQKPGPKPNKIRSLVNCNRRHQKGLLYSVFKVQLRGWKNHNTANGIYTRCKSLKPSLRKVRG